MTKRVFFALVIAALVLAALPGGVVAQDPDPDAMITVVERYVNDLWSGWQFDIADEIIADNFVVHLWGATEMDWDTYFENIIEPTPTQQDFSTDYQFMFVDGDYVVAGGSWGGKVFADIPAVDDTERSNGVDIYRIEDNKIAELWIMYDTMSFMQQVGYVPAEGEVMQDEPWDIALGETSSTPEAHKALLVEIFQNLADHDLDSGYANYTEDAVVHDQGGNDMTWEEAKTMLTDIQTAWPDHHAEDVKYFAAGDLAVTPFTLVFAEDEVEFGGVNVYRFEDGKVAEEWWLYDSFTYMQLTAPSDKPEMSHDFLSGKFVTEFTYEGEVLEAVMMLNSDGSFTHGMGDVVYAEGTYRIDGNQLTWVIDSSCDEVPMTYTWSYEDNILTLTEIEFDPCQNRRQSINGVPYERLDG